MEVKGVPFSSRCNILMPVERIGIIESDRLSIISILEQVSPPSPPTSDGLRSISNNKPLYVPITYRGLFFSY